MHKDVFGKDGDVCIRLVCVGCIGCNAVVEVLRRHRGNVQGIN